MDKELYIKITENGPYLVYGVSKISQKNIVQNENEEVVSYNSVNDFEIKTGPAVLCRCGKSKSAPFCDNSHLKENFDGKEIADFTSFMESSVIYKGKNLTLYDNEKLCALARFCDAKGSIWNLIMTGKKEDDELAVSEANLCPSGRLIIIDNEGNLIEEKLPEAVAILEDEGLQVSGPIYVTGGIRIESADGKSYEIRNRRTLCRCGGSKNKPFCDCTHYHINFKAKYKSE